SPMLASGLAASERPAATDDPQPITFEHVYGSEKIVVGGRPIQPVRWIDPDHYIQKTPDGWTKTHAASATATSWYETDTLKAALLKVKDVTEAEAVRMSGGDWLAVDESRRLAVFHNAQRLIRIGLDGADPRIVDGLPEKIELTTFSPMGTALAFISRDELWCADFEAGTVRQLTMDARPGVRNGKADWVYFEEVYNRNWLAYRWSPDGTRLAYQQFDDRHVPKFQISDHQSVSQSFEAEYYPKAGESNPFVRLGIVSVSNGITTWIDTSEYPQDDFILAHFNWLPDSSSVYWFGQNRIQTFLDIHLTDPSGLTRTRLRDTTEAWVENPMDLTFLHDGSFLFFSERTGWKHLYHVSPDGKAVRPITSGAWEARDLLGLSGDQSFAFIMGTKDSPIAENLYRVPLKSDSVDAVVRLTPEEGGHVVSLAPGGEQFIDSHSSIQLPIEVTLRDATGGGIRVLKPRDPWPTDKYRFGTVEFRDVPMSDNSSTKAIFVLPPGFDRDRKYPVWIRTYGGPHAPSVKNLWSSRLVDHALANLGIVIMTFDCRSSSGYGAKSAWLCYRRLGAEETKDLISVCDWLEQQTWVDAHRIGMSGHSYGGFLTSYAMTHCDKLCAGIAGAPVTDWANYDTIYTERLMTTPKENPDGYRSSSVVAESSRLSGRLLLIHGLLDDNVHPENSIQLVHALQESNKPFDLMLYPAARHPINGDHYNTLLWNFIVTHMGHPEAVR
ncbi:MAG: DPP IV N-terminal domain-containing protein, partial [Planctomycetota bacterium]